MGIFGSIARAKENDSQTRLSEARTRENDSQARLAAVQIKLVAAENRKANDAADQEIRRMKAEADIQERIRAAEEKARIAQEKRDEARDTKLREEQKKMEERLRQEQIQRDERLRQEQIQRDERLKQEQTQREERLRQEILPLIKNLEKQVAELRQKVLESERDNIIKNRILTGLQSSIRDLLANHQSFESKLACLATDVQLIREDFQGSFDNIGDRLSLLNNRMQQIKNEKDGIPPLDMLDMSQNLE